MAFRIYINISTYLYIDIDIYLYLYIYSEAIYKSLQTSEAEADKICLVLHILSLHLCDQSAALYKQF